MIKRIFDITQVIVTLALASFLWTEFHWSLAVTVVFLVLREEVSAWYRDNQASIEAYVQHVEKKSDEMIDSLATDLREKIAEIKDKIN